MCASATALRMPPVGRLALQRGMPRRNGPAGNVGHDAIRLFSLRSGARPSARWTVRSPLAATGGATAEPIDDAKAYAPHA